MGETWCTNCRWNEACEIQLELDDKVHGFCSEWEKPRPEVEKP